MGLTSATCDYFTNAMLGNAITLFDNANAAIGVGDDSTLFATGQTQLQAEANATSAIRKGMDTGFPVQDPDSDGSTNKIRLQAIFGQAEANWTWQEYAIFNNVTAGAGVMLNREVENVGTKTNNASWVFSVDVSIIT